MKAKTVMAFLLAAAMSVSLIPIPSFAEESSADATVSDTSLDLAAALESGIYTLKKAEQEYLTVECYEIEGVQFCANVLDENFQYMNIWIPKEYVNEDGTFNFEAEVNGYTAATAPIIFRNNCSGWFSGSPENDSENWHL